MCPAKRSERLAAIVVRSTIDQQTASTERAASARLTVVQIPGTIASHSATDARRSCSADSSEEAS
jgi:hypothetical protein